MASKNVLVPPYAQAVITQCELCDRRADARYFCEDCQEDMCKQCKITHERSKFTKNHTVISSAEEVAEEKPVFCTSHPKNQVQLYCNDCNIAICPTCIANKEHQGHDLDELGDAVDKCRKELSKCVSDAKQEVSELEGTLKTVSNIEKEYETQHNETVNGINKRREELKSQVDKTADDLIKDAKKNKSQDIKELQKQGDDISKIILDIKAQIELCEEMLQTERGFPVIQKSADFKQKLNLGPSRTLPRPAIMTRRFVFGAPIDIQEVFGRLEFDSKENEKDTGVSKSRDGQSEKTSSGNKDQLKGTSMTIDTTTVATIITYCTNYCVSTVNDGEAWVAQGQGYHYDMALININGEVKKSKTVNFNINDITVTSEGDILLTDKYGSKIKKYTQDGQYVRVDTIDTSPSYPCGICMTSHNNILVCLYGGFDGGIDGHRVVRMTTNGQIKQTIKRDKKKNKALFTYPQLITENINGDVCVVDYYTVVVLNKYGVLRFKYPGTTKSSNSIGCCHGIACDHYGFILISDHYNNQIHQVDKDGTFIQYVLNEQHGVQRPRGLSIDTTGKLWVCNTGVNYCNYVKVVKYRSQ